MKKGPFNEKGLFFRLEEGSHAQKQFKSRFFLVNREAKG